MTVSGNKNREDSIPRAAQVMDQISRELQARFVDRPLPGDVLRGEAERRGGYAPGGILPSDYCYNRVNKAAISCRHPVFEYLGRNEYRYLGPDYPYTGRILWKPTAGSEQQVGYWMDGKQVFTLDPRKLR